nr:hypothetical protein [Actinomycetota bacterium]
RPGRFGQVHFFLIRRRCQANSVAGVTKRCNVWVPNSSFTSCDLGVFVYQPAEQIATSEVKLGWRCRWW